MSIYRNVLQMEVRASSGDAAAGGFIAACHSGNDVLTCRWVYGHPHEWKINGKIVTRPAAALWLTDTWPARKATWGLTS